MKTGPWGLGWINRKYGLSLRPRTPVFQPSSGRRGVVTGVMLGHSDSLMIRWDGCPHVERPQGCGCGQERPSHGPFAPTEGLEYPETPRLL